MSTSVRFYIFGGEYEKKQISVLIGYKLTRIGELAFVHYDGTAVSMREVRLDLYNYLIDSY